LNNTTGSNNTANGFNAFFSNTGSNNTAVGVGASAANRPEQSVKHPSQ